MEGGVAAVEPGKGIRNGGGSYFEPNSATYLGMQLIAGNLLNPPFP